MSKIALILRSSFESDFLAREIMSRNPERDFAIIFESGLPAKKAKLKRYIFTNKTPIMRSILLDIPSLLIFDWVQRKQVKRKLPFQQKNEFTPDLEVDDINNIKLVEHLQKSEIDFAISFGTSIYRPETLRRINHAIINLHTGALPKYRNVHTDFWAYLDGDYKGIGVTAFQIGEQIDEGQIIVWQETKVDTTDFLWDIKYKNLLNIVEVACELLTKYDSLDALLQLSQSQSQKQEFLLAATNKGIMWPTPRFSSLKRLLKKEIKKARQKSRQLKGFRN